MVDVEASTVINRPVGAVFAFVADFENHPKWERNFVEVKRVSPKPVRVGTVYQCRLRVPGQRVTSRIEITEFTPNQRISFRGDRPALAKPVGSITFESLGDATKVTTLPRPQMGGIFKLLEPMMAGYIRRSNAKHLDKLKTPARTSVMTPIRPARPGTADLRYRRSTGNWGTGAPHGAFVRFADTAAIRR